MSLDCGPQSSNAEATPAVRLGPHRQRPTQSGVHTSRLKQAAPLRERPDKLLNAATSTEVLGMLHRRSCRFLSHGVLVQARRGPTSRSAQCTQLNLSFHQERGAGDERIRWRSCTEEHVFFSHKGVQGPAWSLLVRETLRFDRPTCADLLHTRQNSAAPCRSLH